jgi:hypothetical protein
LTQATTVSTIVLKPYQLSAKFFAERMKGVSMSDSAQIYERLQSINVIDVNGFCIWEKCESCW